jgi:hypothetical protein
MIVITLVYHSLFEEENSEKIVESTINGLDPETKKTVSKSAIYLSERQFKYYSFKKNCESDFGCSEYELRRRQEQLLEKL